MYRYIAFVWPSSDATASRMVANLVRQLQAKSSQWTVALEAPGIVAVHATENPRHNRAYGLPRGMGVVLGRLFEKRALSPYQVPSDPNLDSDCGARVGATGGRSLIEDHWGRYVAFIRDKSHEGYLVLRDPSGGLPCFLTTWNTVTVVFSDIQDVVNLQLKALSINWRYVLAFFRDNHLQIPETAVEGLTQLLPGEALLVGCAHAKRKFLWDPKTFAKDPDLIDFNLATHEVERITKSCIGAWAATSETVLHQLSGGLDSSIVLSCLSQAPSRPRIICENQFVTGMIEGDERRMAQLAATRAGCTLVETEIRPESTLERLLSAPPTVNPTLNLFSFQHSYALNLIAEHQVDTFTSGHGGDQIFYQYPEHVIAADYVYQNGLRSGALQVALNTARLTRGSVWAALHSSLLYGLLRRPFDAYASLTEGATFLTPSASQSVDKTYHMHPWLKDATDLPPGKRFHIWGVVDLQAFHEPSLFRVNLSAPLMFASQPLVETCLRVPTYVLTNAGIDRAVERAAFSRDLPKEIVDRHTKGGTAQYFVRLVKANLPFIRSLVLDGAMVREGFLDKRRLEMALTKESHLPMQDMFPLLNCIAAEAWLHRRLGSQQQAAA